MPTPETALRLYLASASPRRREILDQIGIAHDVLAVPAPPGEDEPQLPGEDPRMYVRRTARDKATRARSWLNRHAAPSHDSAILENHEALDARRPILAADTTVILNNAILGKPRDSDDARRILSLLSGSTHSVHTAVVLSWQNQLWEDVSISEVRFATLSAPEIDAYCGSGEPFGKAGAYGIQGKASMFVEHIAGSYSGIMGLPTYETYRLLTRTGLIEAGG